VGFIAITVIIGKILDATFSMSAYEHKVYVGLSQIAIHAYLAIRMNKITLAAWLHRNYKIVGESPNDFMV
jgi:hypothetical protein